MAQVNESENQFIYPRAGFNLVHVKDTAANDSDKTITVPAGKVWQVAYAHVTFATSGDAGNRQLDVVWADEDGTALHTSQAANAIIANATETLEISSAIQSINETVATYHYMPLSFPLMPEGWSMRFYDSATVAVTADDLTINMLVMEYSPV